MILLTVAAATAWFVVMPLVLAPALVVVALRGEKINPADWRRCAGDNPDDPAAKTCWVHIAAGPFCARHDGSGRQVIYS